MMEPEIRSFLKRVVWSISAVLLYLILLTIFGIGLGWFFFYDKPATGNYIFYGWVLFSTVTVIRLLVRLWKKGVPRE